MGVIKPDVVFFGESLPESEFFLGLEIADKSEGMIIAGTSLNVGTPLTFVHMMKEAKKPIIIINKGKTQADGMADVVLRMNISEAMLHIANELTSPVYI
jgi:NAD-dependent SIR2 family protein deacetylase